MSPGELTTLKGGAEQIKLSEHECPQSIPADSGPAVFVVVFLCVCLGVNATTFPFAAYLTLGVKTACPEAGLGITESVRLQETSKSIVQMLMKMGML